MRLLKAVLAGLFVVAVGFLTAAVIAVSAVVIFVGRLLSGSTPAGGGPGLARESRRVAPMAGDVIDVDATEVPTSNTAH